MSNVREVIELLCKVLYSNGTSKIKAELFRLAKFDNNDTAVAMWKLLFELLYFLDHGVIDEVVIKAYNELTIEEQAVYIKQGLQELGFYSKEFACLPNDMSHGSRELLLAFAWLLGTQNLVDRFMENCASPISCDFPEPTSISLEPNYKQSTHNMTPVEKVQHLQLLNGKMHLNLKRLYSLQREKRQLQHRVHKSTMGSTTFLEREHLSVLEVYLLRHPDYLKKILKLLEKDNVRLQNLLQWKEQENVFWKWMESVLDLKMQERGHEDDKTKLKCFNIPPDILDNLNTERNRLETAIMKYETIIEHIEEIWEQKLEDVSQFQLDRLLRIIDIELEFHKSNIGLDKSKIQKLKFTEPQFMLIKTTNKKASNIQCVDNSVGNLNDGLEDTFDIDDEIRDMEILIERLELQAKQKENHYKQELDRLAANIPETVCIQPTSLR